MRPAVRMTVWSNVSSAVIYLAISRILFGISCSCDKSNDIILEVAFQKKSEEHRVKADYLLLTDLVKRVNGAVKLMLVNCSNCSMECFPDTFVVSTPLSVTDILAWQQRCFSYNCSRSEILSYSKLEIILRINSITLISSEGTEIVHRPQRSLTGNSSQSQSICVTSRSVTVFRTTNSVVTKSGKITTSCISSTATNQNLQHTVGASASKCTLTTAHNIKSASQSACPPQATSALEDIRITMNVTMSAPQSALGKSQTLYGASNSITTTAAARFTGTQHNNTTTRAMTNTTSRITTTAITRHLINTADFIDDVISQHLIAHRETSPLKSHVIDDNAKASGEWKSINVTARTVPTSSSLMLSPGDQNSGLAVQRTVDMKSKAVNSKQSDQGGLLVPSTKVDSKFQMTNDKSNQSCLKTSTSRSVAASGSFKLQKSHQLAAADRAIVSVFVDGEKVVTAHNNSELNSLPVATSGTSRPIMDAYKKVKPIPCVPKISSVGDRIKRVHQTVTSSSNVYSPVLYDSDDDQQIKRRKSDIEWKSQRSDYLYK